MSKENLERFMTQVADSKDLQAKIGTEITDDALVALGVEHGSEFSVEDLQAADELSDAKMEGVAGGIDQNSCTSRGATWAIKSKGGARTFLTFSTGEVIDG